MLLGLCLGFNWEVCIEGVTLPIMLWGVAFDGECAIGGGGVNFVFSF